MPRKFNRVYICTLEVSINSLEPHAGHVNYVLKPKEFPSITLK